MPLEWSMADKDTSAGRIAENRRARYDYFIEERFEAGVALQGWEVKALRAGRLQLAGSLRAPEGRRGLALRRARLAAS